MDAEDIRDNKFDTAAFHRAYENFTEKYIEVETNSLDQQNTMWDDLNIVIASARKTAFKIGFKTAVELMMGECNNGQVDTFRGSGFYRLQ